LKDKKAQFGKTLELAELIYAIEKKLCKNVT